MNLGGVLAAAVAGWGIFTLVALVGAAADPPFVREFGLLGAALGACLAIVYRH